MSKFFENIYKQALKEYVMDDLFINSSSSYKKQEEPNYMSGFRNGPINSEDVKIIFKRELFHPSAKYPSDVKEAMAYCITHIRESKTSLYDIYRIVEHLYKFASRLNEGVYADNLENELDGLVNYIRKASAIITSRSIKLGLNSANFVDIENKLFRIADIYNRTTLLIKNNLHLKNDRKSIADVLLNIENLLNYMFNDLKGDILNAKLNGITIYHSFGKHNEVEKEDLNLDFYLKNLHFADQNAIANAFVA